MKINNGNKKTNPTNENEISKKRIICPVTFSLNPPQQLQVVSN